MKPVKFEGHNVVFGENQPEYQPLPAYLNKCAAGEVVQCWELSFDEIQAIIDSRRIWVMQMTFNQPLQPILVSTNPPFDFKNEEEE